MSHQKEAFGSGTPLYVDQTNNRVGIKTTAMSSYYAKDLVLSADNQGGITIVGGTSDTGQYLAFADGTSGSDRFRGYLQYAHDTNNMLFATDGSEAMRIDSSGRVMIGNTTEGVAGADELTVGNTSGGNGITIRSGTSNNGALYFSDGTSGASEYDGGFEYNHGSQFMRFISAGSERMRINSSGNVGIGTTSISSSDKLSISGGRARIVNSVAQSGNTLDNSSFSGLIINNSNNANGDLAGIVMYPTSQYTAAAGVFGYRESQTAGGLSFWTGSNTGSERMRIEAGGNLLIGSTSYSSSSNNKMIEGNGGVFFARAVTSSAGQLTLANPNGNVGQIRTSGSTTTYATSSDYRLKDNINYTFDATSQIKQLKPCEFNFKTDLTTKIIGFIAHETQEIVPQAVSGTKDQVDADGNIDPQGIDNSHLVPLLVKTIQELESRITALEGA